jgi:hypothetical protein
VPNNRERDRVPFEFRSEGIFGNLGWDTLPSLLLSRAADFMKAIGVGDGDVSGIKASYSNTGGSSVDFVAKDPDTLQAMRTKARNMQLVFRVDMPGKFAWVDMKKTNTELRPNRLTRRAAEFLQDLEDAKFAELASVVALDLHGKLVTIKCARIGGSVQGRWRWFS